MKRVVFISVIVVLLLAGSGCSSTGSASNQPASGKAPFINNFGSDPIQVSPGGSARLTWTVMDASSVSIDQGVGSVSSMGNAIVNPRVTTVYTLTATNASGSTSAVTTISVGAGTSTGATPAVPTASPATGYKPVIYNFWASPGSITKGSGSSLGWNVLGATSVYIDNGVGDVAASGKANIKPGATTTYTLTATNATGTITATAQVFVLSPSVATPIIYSFSASPSTVVQGKNTTLKWKVGNATTVYISGLGNVPASGSRTITPSASTNYILGAVNKAGTSQSAVGVTVVAMSSTTYYDVYDITETYYFEEPPEEVGGGGFSGAGDSGGVSYQTSSPSSPAQTSVAPGGGGSSGAGEDDYDYEEPPSGSSEDDAWDD